MRSLTRLLAVARERQDGSNVDDATIPLFDFPSERSAQRFRGIVSDCRQHGPADVKGCKLASATLRFSSIFQGGLVSADNAMFSALGGNYNHGRP